MMTVLMVFLYMRTMLRVPGAAHHAKHLNSSRPEELPNQHAAEYEEHDVEPRRIVPGDCGRSDRGAAFCGDETDRVKEKIDGKCGSRHRQVNT